MRTQGRVWWRKRWNAPSGYVLKMSSQDATCGFSRNAINHVASQTTHMLNGGPVRWRRHEPDCRKHNLACAGEEHSAIDASKTARDRRSVLGERTIDCSTDDPKRKLHSYGGLLPFARGNCDSHSFRGGDVGLLKYAEQLLLLPR